MTHAGTFRSFGRSPATISAGALHRFERIDDRGVPDGEEILLAPAGDAAACPHRQAVADAWDEFDREEAARGRQRAEAAVNRAKAKRRVPRPAARRQAVDAATWRAECLKAGLDPNTPVPTWQSMFGQLAEATADAFRDLRSRLDVAGIAPTTAPLDLALVGLITREKVDELVNALAAAPGAPVRLEIDSQGGDLHSAFALYDALHERQASTTAHVTCECYSAATIVLCGARRRTADRYAMLMVHPPQLPTDGGFNDGILNATGVRMLDTYARATGQPAAVWECYVDASEDTYFDVDQAIAAGLLHQIVDTPAQPSPVIIARAPADELTTEEFAAMNMTVERVRISKSFDDDPALCRAWLAANGGV